jgi:flavin reductase (DIM6/NTAB) family NADH-FMN oxidoreductase RutF
LAAQFSRSGADRFAGVKWSRHASGVPLVSGPESWLLASVRERIHAGDSTVLLADVVGVHRAESGSRPPGAVGHPLAYSAGSYGKVVPITGGA